MPVELNHYKDFLRGQNHYDTYLLSGASGHGARSFYYPPKAFDNCAVCHMPEKDVGDLSVNFAGRTDPATGKRTQRNHLFPAANTGLPELLKNEPATPISRRGWTAPSRSTRRSSAASTRRARTRCCGWTCSGSRTGRVPSTS